MSLDPLYQKLAFALAPSPNLKDRLCMQPKKPLLLMFLLSCSFIRHWLLRCGALRWDENRAQNPNHAVNVLFKTKT